MTAEPRDHFHVQPAHILAIVLILTVVILLPTSTLFRASPGNTPTAPHPARTIDAAVPAPAGTYFDHLLVIMDENHGMQDICGGNPPPCNGPNTPYMNSLANNNSIAQQYLSLVTTSWPDYYGILGASVPAGCASATPSPCYPPAGSLTNTNLVDRFATAGLSWKGYFETQNVASGCDTTDQEPYTHIHNGFIAFQDITTNTTRCNSLVLANPSTCPAGVNNYPSDCTLLNDLNSGSAPNYMWLTPNDCDDMRSNSHCTNACSTGGSACVTAGDNYLKNLVPNILNSQTFQTTRSALFITFDEGDNFCPLNGLKEDCLYAVWVGPLIKTSYASPQLYTDYSLTKTIEVNWNLAPMTSNDTNATPMTEFFKSDFTITATQPFPVNAGQSSSETIKVSPLSGFTGTVSLTDTIPTGLSCGTISPSNVTASGNATVTCSSLNAGNYTLTITGTSGSLAHSTSATFSIQDFKVTLSSPFLTAVQVFFQSNITISSLNHFTGTVSLTTMIPGGLNCPTLTPANVTGSGTAQLSCSASSAANYQITIRGTSGLLTHSASATIQVVDFAVAGPPSLPAMTIGSNSTSTFNITSLNGYTGNVTLTAIVQPPGDPSSGGGGHRLIMAPSTLPSATFNPGSVPLFSGGIARSNLTIILPPGSSSGSYLVTITATDGIIVHYLQFNFNATQSGTTSPMVNGSGSTVLVHKVAGASLETYGIAGLLVLISLLCISNLNSNGTTSRSRSRAKPLEGFHVSGRNKGTSWLAQGPLWTPVSVRNQLET